jgi:hypothetical protein
MRVNVCATRGVFLLLRDNSGRLALHQPRHFPDGFSLVSSPAQFLVELIQ